MLAVMALLQAVFVSGCLMIVAIETGLKWFAIALSIVFALWLEARSLTVSVELGSDYMRVRNPMRTYRIRASELEHRLTPNTIVKIPLLAVIYPTMPRAARLNLDTKNCLGFSGFTSSGAFNAGH